MTVYHVDKYYGKDDKIYYNALPYNLYGTFLTYYGIDFKPLRWKINWHPWHYRYTEFFKWLWYTRLTEKSANKLSDKLNKRIKKEHNNEQ